MLTKPFLFAGFAAALLAVTTPASANFIVTDVETPYSDILTLTGPIAAEADVGQQVLTTTSGTIDAWCVDLFHDGYVGAGQELPFTPGMLGTDGNGDALTTAQINQIAGLSNYGDAVLSGPATAAFADFSASIQLAIWTTEYADFSYDAAGDTALAPLISADIAAAASYGGNATALISLSGSQSLVTADAVRDPGVIVPNALVVTPDPAVPEPASLMLLAGSLAALLALRRQAVHRIR